MITESEQKALQLAKKVFEHFTHDALPIAKEIIALEREMGDYVDKDVTIPLSLQPTEGEKNNESKAEPVATDIQPNPKEEVNSIRVAGSLNYPRMQADEQPVKREYEEVPY